jgi:tetratricopeptide (TPR) repeat protein
MAEAGAVAERLIADFPEDPDARELSARLALYRGRTEQAVAAFEKCLELNPDYVHARRGLGLIAAKKGDYQAAIAHFREALRRSPDASDCRLELARLLIDQGESGEAVALLEPTTAAGPNGAEAWVLLGMARLQRREYELAKKCYAAAVELEPGNAKAQLGLATALARLGEHEAARKQQSAVEVYRSQEQQERRVRRGAYNDLTAMSADVAEMHTNTGRVFAAHGEVAIAEQLWRRAAALDPRSLNCRQALAFHYLQQRKYLDAIEVLRQLAALDPGKSMYAIEISRLYAAADRLDAAEKVLTECCQTLPDDAAVHIALVEFHLQSGQNPQAALTHARKAHELSPTAANCLNLGAAYERNNDLPNAVVMVEQALQKEPDNARYRELLAQLKQKMQGVDKQ